MQEIETSLKQAGRRAKFTLNKQTRQDPILCTSIPQMFEQLHPLKHKVQGTALGPTDAPGKQAENHTTVYTSAGKTIHTPPDNPHQIQALPKFHTCKLIIV